jgi:hypothetical protein
MGVAILLGEEGKHLVEHTRVHRSSGLHVEVDRSASRLGTAPSLGSYGIELEAEHFFARRVFASDLLSRLVLCRVFLNMIYGNVGDGGVDEVCGGDKRAARYSRREGEVA